MTECHTEFNRHAQKLIKTYFNKKFKINNYYFQVAVYF